MVDTSGRGSQFPRKRLLLALCTTTAISLVLPFSALAQTTQSAPATAYPASTYVPPAASSDPQKVKLVWQQGSDAAPTSTAQPAAGGPEIPVAAAPEAVTPDTAAEPRKRSKRSYRKRSASKERTYNQSHSSTQIVHDTPVVTQQCTPLPVNLAPPAAPVDAAPIKLVWQVGPQGHPLVASGYEPRKTRKPYRPKKKHTPTPMPVVKEEIVREEPPQGKKIVESAKAPPPPAPITAQPAPAKPAAPAPAKPTPAPAVVAPVTPPAAPAKPAPAPASAPAAPAPVTPPAPPPAAPVAAAAPKPVSDDVPAIQAPEMAPPPAAPATAAPATPAAPAQPAALTPPPPPPAVKKDETIAPPPPPPAAAAKTEAAPLKPQLPPPPPPPAKSDKAPPPPPPALAPTKAAPPPPPAAAVKAEPKPAPAQAVAPAPAAPAPTAPPATTPAAVTPAPAIAEPTVAAAPAESKPAAPPAPPVDATQPPALRIVFKPTETAIPLSVKDGLSSLVGKVRGQDDQRITLIGYASGMGEQASTSRRVSLSRALSVRTALIDQGISPLRINVLAEGDKNPGGDPDRVDIFLRKANDQR